MAISQAVCTSFKQELLQGIHNFTNGSGGGTTTSTGSGNTFKLALYTSSASLGAATTAFTTDICRAPANRAVLILDFGADKSSSTGDFIIQFPTADASNAIIRIA